MTVMACHAPLLAKIGGIVVLGFCAVGLVNAGIGSLLLGRFRNSQIIGVALLGCGFLCLAVSVFSAGIFGACH